MNKVIYEFKMKTVLVVLLLLLPALSVTSCRRHKQPPCQKCEQQLKECNDRIIVIGREREQEKANCQKAIAEEKKNNDDCKRNADSRVAVVTTQLSKEKEDHSKSKLDVAALKSELSKEKEDHSKSKLEVAALKAELSEEKEDHGKSKLDVAALKSELSKEKEDHGKSKLEVAALKVELSEEKEDHNKSKHDAESRVFVLTTQLSQEKEDHSKSKRDAEEAEQKHKQEKEECIEELATERVDHMECKTKARGILRHLEDFTLETLGHSDFASHVVSFCLGSAVILIMNFFSIVFSARSRRSQPYTKKVD